MRQTALIVDGDSDSRHLLSSTLATAGIDSIHAATGAAMWQQLDDAPDIIILDLSLPDGDVLDLLGQLRQTSDLPVLIHAARFDEIQRIVGIETGADDFLPKSCSTRELLARVRGLLRRTRRSAPMPRSEKRRLHFGAWTLDTATRQLSRADDSAAALGGPGYALLLAFLEHPF
ncbi:MAG TPA: response regulator transcription factor, partial [Azonexus sp.]|nr:response regulator transcription factor [Azonexus sp.]